MHMHIGIAADDIFIIIATMAVITFIISIICIVEVQVIDISDQFAIKRACIQLIILPPQLDGPPDVEVLALGGSRGVRVLDGVVWDIMEIPLVVVAFVIHMKVLGMSVEMVRLVLLAYG